MYEELKGHGVTENTPKNLMLGAGTLHKNFKFDTATKKWNFAESLIGATSGGNKLIITPEIKTVEVDGALVKVKGLDFKTGEVAKLETNLVEITPELLKTTVIGQLVDSDIEGYDLIESKADIEAGDYFENVAFVGKKTDGTPIVVLKTLGATFGSTFRVSTFGVMEQWAVVNPLLQTTSPSTNPRILTTMKVLDLPLQMQVVISMQWVMAMKNLTG